MKSSVEVKRSGLFARTALGVALAMGIAGAATMGEPAMAQRKNQSGPKIEFSSAFSKAAAELDKALGEASKNPAVQAATKQARDAGAAKNQAAKAAAAAQVDAALGGGKAKLDAAAAAASTSGDKLKLGEMTRTYGVLVDDLAMQHSGLVQMIDSGALQPQAAGQVQYLAGVTAYQQGDYAGVVRYLEPAMASGYRDPDGLIQRLLADSYKRTNNSVAAMKLAEQDIAAAKAAGGKPSEESLRTALQAAYDSKQAASATDLAAQLVQHYPDASSWNAAIAVTRALSSLPAQDNLDLMRLMSRTGAMTQRNDYIEYIENADPRRLPGESLKAIEAGVAAGKLNAGEVAEWRKVASDRVSADRASLVGLERDARAASATGVTVAGAADAFLSYGEPAKAEDLYKIALNKSGVDRNRVLTRLGISQVDQGKGAEAQQNFAQVQGPRAPMAKLWSAYAATKGGAAPQ